MQHSCARISTNIGLRWIYQAVLSSFLQFSKPLSNQALLPSAACSCDVMQIPWWVTSSHGWCILNNNLSSQSNDVIAVHKTVFWKYIMQYTANITIAESTDHLPLCLDLYFTFTAVLKLTGCWMNSRRTVGSFLMHFKWILTRNICSVILCT